ncbi:hypothetical protein [Burkholderia sp. Bp9012]|uniref:hypothetical protein n=1 Tax=Burkholderia sp. Bp9012 TaxID=2184562 RepID=UPI000F590D3B|nr:hypothetical protein [Burkholderia sp. Bp9012]
MKFMIYFVDSPTHFQCRRGQLRVFMNWHDDCIFACGRKALAETKQCTDIPFRCDGDVMSKIGRIIGRAGAMLGFVAVASHIGSATGSNAIGLGIPNIWKWTARIATSDQATHLCVSASKPDLPAGSRCGTVIPVPTVPTSDFLNGVCTHGRCESGGPSVCNEPAGCRWPLMDKLHANPRAMLVGATLSHVAPGYLLDRGAAGAGEFA